jgi:hypothetical protein
MQLGGESQAITLFEQQPVRRVWHDNRWFYSVIDTVAVLVQNDNPRRYWSDLKRKLKNQGFADVYERIVQLKLLAPDGKFYATDCADTETLLRIIQSIPSPKAEPFKQWLAGLGADVIDDRTEDQRRLDYRGPKAEAHKGLHAEIHERGVRSRRDHAEFDIEGHKGLYGGETPSETEAKRAIPPGEGPSWMGSEEMVDNMFRDVQSRAYIKRLDITGKGAVTQAHEEVSRSVRKYIVEELGGTPPEQLPKATKSIEQAAKDEKRRRTKGMDLFPEDDDLSALAPPEDEERDA